MRAAEKMSEFWTLKRLKLKENQDLAQWYLQSKQLRLRELWKNSMEMEL